MRKALIGVMLGALVFTAVAFAASQQNTVDYTSTVKYKGKPKPKKPKNVTYNGILAIRTADEKQPNTAPLTELFIAKQLKTNGAKLKSCKKSDFDAQPEIPAKCTKATVGEGDASAMVGAPGDDPQTESLIVPLDVKAINGPKGKTLFLAVYGGAATGFVWRAIPGKITKIKKGKFGSKVGFRVPKELQEPAGPGGAQVALTDFNVTVKTKRKTKAKRSFFTIVNCPKSKRLPTKAVVHFNDDTNTQPAGTKASNGNMSCHR